MNQALNISSEAKHSVDQRSYKDVTVSPWRPLLAGISVTKAQATQAFGLDHFYRLQEVTVAKIDLTQPDLRFFSTTKAGPENTLGARITDFIRGIPTAMAINGNFCWPNFEAFYQLTGSKGDYHTFGVPYRIFGAAMTEGQWVSSPDTLSDDRYAGATALVITKDNQARICQISKCSPAPKDAWTVVAGGPQPCRPQWPYFQPSSIPTLTVGGSPTVLENGENQGEPQEIPYEAVAARTAVGLSQDGQTMFWLIAHDLDDFNPDNPDFDSAHPQMGCAFYDIAEWLKLFGAYQGMILDGGKSSVLAYSNEAGIPALLSRPRPDPEKKSEEERLRCVGNFLGVQSTPI